MTPPDDIEKIKKRKKNAPQRGEMNFVLEANIDNLTTRVDEVVSRANQLEGRVNSVENAITRLKTILWAAGVSAATLIALLGWIFQTLVAPYLDQIVKITGF